TAYLPTSSVPQPGIVIPRSALVRFSGRTWAYVEARAGRFTRREVVFDHPTETGWFVTSGFAPGDRVVVIGGEALLSEELKSEIRISEYPTHAPAHRRAFARDSC